VPTRVLWSRPATAPIVAFVVGAPLLLASDIAVFFGGYAATSAAALAALPIAVFEFGSGVWLIVKGFDPSSPLLAVSPTTDQPIRSARDTMIPSGPRT
jgi:hypothetical protein